MDITLALGGGGSRGYAHIGVIHRLEQEGYRIRAVAGTSAGGIIAAVYAAGYSPDQMIEIFANIDQSKLFGRSNADGPGLLGLSGATELLEDLLGQRTFEDLRIPCAMAALDIKTECEVVLDQGLVVDAVLATIALPGIFPPKQRQDYELVDGAVLDPVPVSLARALLPNLPVVAVVLASPVNPAERVMANLPLPVPIPAPIIERVTRLRVAQAFGVFLQSVDAGSRMLGELRLQIDSPEVIVHPDVGAIGLLDKVDVYKLVHLGERAMDAALPKLKRATSWPNRLKRGLTVRRGR